MKRAIEIEEAFKQLHEGIYSWGEKKLKESIKQGFVETSAGWRIYLPNYDKFKELDIWLSSLTKDFWDKYSYGKKIMKKYWELKNKEELTDKDKEHWEFCLKAFEKGSTDIYDTYRNDVSDYFKLKSEYFKMCLNAPAQSGSSFQTKSALIALFKIIRKNGHMWEARISNSPYDEILMEVKEELTEFYKTTMEDCMVTEGNKWLKSGLFSMSADAAIGMTWWDIH